MRRLTLAATATIAFTGIAAAAPTGLGDLRRENATFTEKAHYGYGYYYPRYYGYGYGYHRPYYHGYYRPYYHGHGYYRPYHYGYGYYRPRYYRW
jgi:hypothetical protein